MTVLMVPAMDPPFPTLGGLVCDFIESSLVFGPGDLRGEPAVLDPEKRALIYRMYEVFPQDHPQAGRRRFKRVGLSLAKGLAKTELAAWIAACELHPDAPVRCVGWDDDGNPIGGAVTDPYIPLVAYTQEQSDELAYGALRAILDESPVRGDFDIGIERIMRRRGDGKAVSLASAPSARDGARTTFQVCDEPLDIETPVPTPFGWKRLGSIGAGDMVYGRDGRAVRVMGASPVQHGRTCYRVTFADGDSIVTDASHRWKVIEWTNRPAGEQVRTTEQMHETGVDTSYGKRWRLPRASGYDGVEADLPIAPYVLGCWLGDGSTDAGYIHSGVEDAAEMREFVGAAGYDTVASRDTTHPTVVRFLPTGLKAQLRGVGVLGSKRIPTRYMFSSREQRLGLLRGLMDTDGFSTPRGACVFVQGRRELADDVAALVRSLGASARVTTQVDSRSRTGVMHKVHFSPSFCPFQMDRKARRCPARQRTSTHWPTIASIEPCESVPVRCIAVESDDHLFLAGEGLRLTHNTHWWIDDRLKLAYQTMTANLPKRRIADPWMLEVTTAFEPGRGSVAEGAMEYARAIDEGRTTDARLFYFHREASADHDISTEAGARAAVLEASGPAAAWRDVDGIVDLWRDPRTVRSFWTRVWLNRIVRGSSQAFDSLKWAGLATAESPVNDGDTITLGFDGSKRHDGTALVATHVASGHQWIVGLWERPLNAPEDWYVPVEEVDDTVTAQFERYDVWRMYCDPAYWQDYTTAWHGRYPERVVDWWTNRRQAMTRALAAYANAISDGNLSHDNERAFARHIGNAHRLDLAQRDDQGQPLWLIQKERHDSPHKIDIAMAAVLSWQARMDAVASGVLEKTPDRIPNIYIPGVARA